MKLLPIALAAALAACTPVESEEERIVGKATAEISAGANEAGDPPAQTLEYKVSSYGDGWNVEDYWAGEYPHGIGIFREGVVVKARVYPHPDEPAVTDCPLEYRASYHPWNAQRVEADKLEFKTAFKTYDMVIETERAVDLSSEDGEESRVFKPGDVVTYVSYLAEGWGRVEIDGKRYDAHMNAFDELDNMPRASTGASEDDEWLGLDCGNERRYLLLSDLRNVAGISPGLEGMAEYGRMKDLSEDQAELLRYDYPE